MKPRFFKILVLSFSFLFLSSSDVFSFTTQEIVLLGRRADARRIKKEQRAEQKKKDEEKQKTPKENPKKDKKKKQNLSLIYT